VRNEIRGTTSDGIELYALIFSRSPIRAGDDVKIVWRITAGGPLVSATSPHGTPAKVTFGPESHLSSSFNRPGEEWGVGFVFDEPGCWHLRFRSDTRANIWLVVEPALA
jgi:hypothetical protein